MTQAAVQVRDAAKLYASTTGALNWALTDVSLDIGTGEFVCAIGPSGCGKTTLLNLIAGFVQPTLGTVTAQGQAVQSPGPDRGVVFQEYALYPWLSARRNVEFGLRQQGLPAAERRERTFSTLSASCSTF